MAAIATTTTAVASTSRSANGTAHRTASLDEAVAFGMVLRHRHAHLAERGLDGVHHHVGPADEILVVGVGRRQVTARKTCGVDMASARPSTRSGGFAQRVDDRQVEPRLASASSSSRKV